MSRKLALRLARVVAVSCALLSVILTGCGGDKRPASSAPSQDDSTTPVSSVSSPLSPVALGESFTITDPGFAAEATVFDVDQNVTADTSMLTSGHWVGADVQTCLKDSHGAFTVSWSNWSVSDSAHGQYPASSDMYGDFPVPLYPFKPAPLAVGECVRGWVLFAVAYGVKVSTVKYMPDARAPAFWSAT